MTSTQKMLVELSRRFSCRTLTRPSSFQLLLAPVLLVLALAATALSCPPSPNDATHCWITCPRARLWCGNRLVGQLERGSEVQAVKTYGEWTFVRYYRCDLLKCSGWMESSQLVGVDRARDVLTSLIEQAPTDGRLYYARARTTFRHSEKHASDAERIVADLDEAIRLAPTHIEALCFRAGLRVAFGQYKSAIEDLDIVLKNDTSFPHLFVLRGQAALATGDYEQAIRDLNAARALDHCLEVFGDRAVAWLKLGNLDRAISDAMTSRKRTHGVKETKVIIRALLGKGEGTHALEETSRLLNSLRDDEETIFLLATAFEKTQHYDKAKTAFEDAIDRSSTATSDLRVEILVGASRFLSTCPKSELRAPRQALEYARMALAARLRECLEDECDRGLLIRTDPLSYPAAGIKAGWKDWKLLECLASAYAANEEYREAVVWQRKAIETAPQGEHIRLKNRLQEYQVNRGGA